MALGQRSWFSQLSRKDRNTLIASVLAGVLLLPGVGWVVLELSGGKSLDPETFCPDSGPSHHVLVILDRTDPLTPTQARLAKRVVREIKQESKVGTKISLFEVDPGENDGLSEPLFSVCKPRDGTKANRLYENPRLIEKRFKQRFGKPMEKVFLERLDRGGSPTSPIIESLADASLLDDFGKNLESRTLILFSDLMQNSKSWSHYGQFQGFESFQSSRAGQALIPDLQGVKVKIYYLLRFQKGNVLQPTGHIRFWDRFFTAAEVKNLIVRKVR